MRVGDTSLGETTESKTESTGMCGIGEVSKQAWASRGSHGKAEAQSTVGARHGEVAKYKFSRLVLHIQYSVFEYSRLDSR